MGVAGKDYSEKVAAEIDAEVERIMNEAHERAKDTIKKHRKLLDAIAIKLVEVETLEREDFEKILIMHGIEPKKPEEDELSIA
jgi:cell division protease FtsH